MPDFEEQAKKTRRSMKMATSKEDVKGALDELQQSPCYERVKAIGGAVAKELQHLFEEATKLLRKAGDFAEQLKRLLELLEQILQFIDKQTNQQAQKQK